MRVMFMHPREVAGRKYKIGNVTELEKDQADPLIKDGTVVEAPAWALTALPPLEPVQAEPAAHAPVAAPAPAPVAAVPPVTPAAAPPA